MTKKWRAGGDKLAGSVYERVKADIFEFRLLPEPRIEAVGGPGEGPGKCDIGEGDGAENRGA